MLCTEGAEVVVPAVVVVVVIEAACDFESPSSDGCPPQSISWMCLWLRISDCVWWGDSQEGT